MFFMGVCLCTCCTEVFLSEIIQCSHKKEVSLQMSTAEVLMFCPTPGNPENV